MNANAQQWVEALESGEFKQTSNWLHRVTPNYIDEEKGIVFPRQDVGYCCLGVACEVFDRANPGVLQREVVDMHEQFDFQSASLPDVVTKWLGLQRNFGEHRKTSLSIANDNRNLSFVEIAAIIRSEPEGLFG